MSKCQYKTKYFDYDKKETLEFHCNKESLNTEFCMYHDATYQNYEEILKGIESAINNTISNNEPLFCIGYNIPKIKIKKSISKPVYFTKANFQNLDFSGSKLKQADFSGAKFHDANFSETIFDEVDFLAIESTGKTNFSKTIFKNKVNFSEAKFEDANFTEAKFSHAHFLGTEFKTADFDLSNIEESDFFGVKFVGQVNFVGAKIKYSAFPNAKFQSLANFTGAKLEKINFTQSKFNEANFDHAFIKISNLQGVVFQGNANFSSSELEKVDFFKVNFKKNVSFSEARLNEIVFSETRFNGLANFAKTFFTDVKFTKADLQEADFTKSQFNGPTSFNEVLFREQERVFFYVEDLSKVSFLCTLISNVRFGDNVKWAGKNGFQIIDEELLTNSPDGSIIESVIAIYRNLRKNYENRFRYEEACKFFEREIELRKIFLNINSDFSGSELEILEKKLKELLSEFEMLKKGMTGSELLKKNIKS